MQCRKEILWQSETATDKALNSEEVAPTPASDPARGRKTLRDLHSSNRPPAVPAVMAPRNALDSPRQ